MCTDKIKYFNVQDGRAFVITQSIKKLKEDYQKEVLEDKGYGYYPAYVRNDLSKLFGFRTDYEINTYEDFEKIFK